MGRRLRPWSAVRVGLPLLPLLVAPAALAGQLATVDVEENLRAEPNGAILARVLPGALLSVEEPGERWIGVRLEGWVWSRSVDATEREGYDLVVTASPSENLRSEPNGTVLARMREGMLLEELERRDAWIRVRRTASMWAPSLRVDPAADEGAEETSTTGGPPAASLSVPGGGALRTAPDGDTLVVLPPGADLHLLERRGSWARVRLEGWLWAPPRPDSARAEPARVAPSSVRADPQRYVGRIVTWVLQFISLERAERGRSELFGGEPYLLTREPGDAGGFVYVAVPPDRLDEVDGLVPLERITVMGRIRSGRSDVTGNPILDLIQLERRGSAGG